MVAVTTFVVSRLILLNAIAVLDTDFSVTSVLVEVRICEFIC